MTVRAWAALPSLLAPGMRVYVPGGVGESAPLTAALRAAASACAGIHFIGVWLPGINHCDYASLHPEARATAFFIGRELRASFAERRIAFLPLSYFEIYRHLETEAEIDLAFLQVTPPDRDGRLGFGCANDFTPAVAARARRIAVHINPLMPRTRGAGSVALAQVDCAFEAASPLLADSAGTDPVWQAIGGNVAGLIRDGDTLEVGIGRVQGVLGALTGHRGLRLHSGAVTSTLLPLLGAGALAGDDGAVTCGMALGGPALYDFVADNPLVRFAPVGETHDIGVLRRIERFVAINGVIEIDLLGQANAETAGGRQVSGAGGILDFMRGARLASGGRAIVCLPATGDGGAVSRIVPALAPGCPVSVPRGDIDIVVTEYGTASLRRSDLDARAEALIAIAAPAFRDRLAGAWAEMRRRM
jgi:acyl-CoA hydrolase